MKKFLIYTAIVVVLAGLATGYFTIFYSYSDGVRSGQIVKFSRKGIAIKTYEGQLAIRGFDEGDNGAMSNIWNFSVKRGQQQVRDEIQKAMEKGYDVRLYYDEYMFQYDWRGDTKYFINRIEKVED